MKKKFTKDAGKELWLQIIKIYLEKNAESYLLNVIKKLKLVRFTYNGDMRQTRSRRDVTADKRFLYAASKFPSLIKIWESEKERIENETI